MMDKYLGFVAIFVCSGALVWLLYMGFYYGVMYPLYFSVKAYKKTAQKLFDEMEKQINDFKENNYDKIVCKHLIGEYEPFEYRVYTKFYNKFNQWTIPLSILNEVYRLAHDKGYNLRNLSGIDPGNKGYIYFTIGL